MFLSTFKKSANGKMNQLVRTRFEIFREVEFVILFYAVSNTVQAERKNLQHFNVHNDFSGGDRRGETPVPIPNTEVKPSTGDGTFRAV